MLDRKKHVEEIIDGAQFLKRKASTLSCLNETGITTSQWLVLGHLAREEGSTTNATALALNMTGSAVTQLVNGLVTKGFVIREQNPEDRRAHRLFLSRTSKKRIADFKKKRVTMMLHMFKALNDKEFEQYLALNKKIVQGLSKK